MLRLMMMTILCALCISTANAEENNMFVDMPAAGPIRDSEYLEPLPEPAKPLTYDYLQNEFDDYNFWNVGKEESHSPLTPVENNEVKSAPEESRFPENPPIPEFRPDKPAPKKTQPKKPEVKKPEPKKPTPKKPSPQETQPRAHGVRCEMPRGLAPACNQNGIKSGLEAVLNDCGTVRCYLKLFHMETSCRPFLTHQAIVTAYGMCSIEKDRNLRKRFGSDCSNIDTVTNQIKCCRKMMKTAGRAYFEPVKVGRLGKCE